MPSTDWRESADNWFGGCCCSFGGVSEKLVNGYAISYSCVTGKCLVNSTTVVIFKDDLEERLVMEWESNDKKEHDVDGMFGRLHENQYGEDVSPISKHLNDKFSSLSVVDKTRKAEQTGDNTFCQFPLLNDSENSAEVQPSQEIHTNCSRSTSESCWVGEGLNDNFTPDKKFLLNGFLENIFMIRSSHVSKAVKWVEILCPKCSFLLGAYPSYASENEPFDGGIRFFKYCISTCSQPNGLMNVFRKYTLERMFTSQLLENAKDELMFRTLVRDIKSKAPALQIVMLNPNSWSYSGCCSGIANSESNIELRPVMKALFSHSSHITEFPTSQMENWVRNNDADEVYMFTEQIKELIDLLEEGKTSMPLSYTNLQGLPLSSLRR